MECKQTVVVENRLEIENQKTIAAFTETNTKVIDAEKVRSCVCRWHLAFV